MLVPTATAALAMLALALGILALSRAAPELTATDLLREGEATATRARQEGALIRALLPPAPRLLIERSDRAALEARLVQAGRPYGFSPEQFIRFKVLVGILVALIAILLFSGSDPLFLVVLAVAALAGGYHLPDVYLGSLARARVIQLERALPNMVDSLALAMGAGMDLEAALRRVTPRLRGPLRDAMEEVLGELRAGYALGAALGHLAERTTSSELGEMLSFVQQSRRLGVGLVEGMRTRAIEMRVRRRLHAQEAAQQAPLKMMIPLVIFFLPALMLVFLAPAILSFISGG